MSRLREKLYNSNGTTLLEVIIAIAVLGVILVPLSDMFAQSMRTTMKARDYMKANQYAQSTMEHIKDTDVGLFDFNQIGHPGIYKGNDAHNGFVVNYEVIKRYPLHGDFEVGGTSSLQDINDFVIYINQNDNEAYIKQMITQPGETNQVDISTWILASINPQLNWYVKYSSIGDIIVGYNDGGTVHEIFTISNSDLPNDDKAYQYKVYVDGGFSDSDIRTIDVFNQISLLNQPNKEVDAIIMGPPDIASNLKTNSQDGIVRSYYNVNLDDNLKFAWLYSIDITVTKDTQTLVTLNGTKRGE